MTKLAYKVLNKDGTAYHGGKGSWPLPKGKRPGKWVTVKGPLVPCRNGLHICEPKYLLGWAGPAVFRVEYDDTEMIDHGDKLVVRKARLVSRTSLDDRTWRLFAADCAERALRRERKAGREPDPRSWAAVKATRQYANGEIDAAAGDAAWDAARDAARAAAGDAAWDAAWAAAGAAARAAARAAAWAAAGAAAWDAAWDAARDTAWDAARDTENRWQVKRLVEYAEGVRG